MKLCAEAGEVVAQVGRLGDMERARRDEQDVVGLDHAVLGVDRRSLDQRQEGALHALARDVGALQLAAAGDLVDLVQEHDAVVLDRLNRFLNDLLIVEKLVGLVVDENLVGVANGQPPRVTCSSSSVSLNFRPKLAGSTSASKNGSEPPGPILLSDTSIPVSPSRFWSRRRGR